MGSAGSGSGSDWWGMKSPGAVGGKIGGSNVARGGMKGQLLMVVIGDEIDGRLCWHTRT